MLGGMLGVEHGCLLDRGLRSSMFSIRRFPLPPTFASFPTKFSLPTSPPDVRENLFGRRLRR
jgi:hypothetical protein